MLMIYKTTFSKKIQLTEDVFLFRFQLVEPKEISFKAGQYLILKINDKPRLYSIASPDFQKDSFELLVQIVPGGLASTYLSGLKVGDQVTFQGPAGVFNLRESPRPKIFLATGTGMAPMRAMINSKIKNQNSKLQLKDQKFYLFWGVKTYKDVYLLEEFKNLQFETSDFKFQICLSREQSLDMISEEDKKYFSLGHVDEVMEEEIEKLRNTAIKKLSNEEIKERGNLNYSLFDFYLCGSPVVVESLRKYLEEKGAPKEQVFFEKF